MQRFSSSLAIHSLLLALVLGGGAVALGAQLSQSRGAGDSEQARFLEVRQRQIELRAERAELERMQQLFDDDLISKAELESAVVAVERAQLNYQNAVLDLVSLEPRILVRRAVKEQTEDQRRVVHLTIENRTPTFDDSQFQLLNNFEGADPIPEELRTRTVRDIFVSIKARNPSVGGLTSIALPYEVHVDQLRYGSHRSLEFELLRDVDDVVVVVSYRGVERELGVELQQAETATVATLTAAQGSLEADLGSQALFDLRLERSTIDQRSYQLRVLNLPSQINYSFVDPSTQSRLSRVNLQAGQTEMAIQLRAFLPEQAGSSLTLDEPINLWVIATTEEADLEVAPGESFSEADLAGSRVGRVALELIPRGIGEIQVSAPTLFSEIGADETVESILSVRNAGSRRIDNIRLKAEHPLGWQVEFDPDVVSSLTVGQEQQVRLAIQPASDVSVGEYEVRIETESYSFNRPLPTVDKIYRVSVKSRTGLTGIVLLIGLLLAVTVGVILVGVRIVRR